jgi:hypothetical protein
MMMGNSSANFMRHSTGFGPASETAGPVIRVRRCLDDELVVLRDTPVRQRGCRLLQHRTHAVSMDDSELAEVSAADADGRAANHLPPVVVPSVEVVLRACAILFA